MNNKQLKAAFLLMDNLLDSRGKKYNRASLAEKLKDEGLPSSAGSITRLLNFIDQYFEIKIKTNRTENSFVIDYEYSAPNYTEKYLEYRTLYFRNLLQKTTLEHDITKEHIVFGFDTQNKNIAFLNPFLCAILERKKIKITYQSFYQDTASEYVIKPIFLKEYLNRWYVICEKLEQRHPIFAIDRILNYEICSQRFTPTGKIRSDFFKNIVGINYDAPLKKIKLWVDKQQYPYFKTLPFHFSQKTEQQTPEGYIISFQVVVNFELKQWILFFGAYVKVLEPQSLQKEIIAELENTLALYKK